MPANEATLTIFRGERKTWRLTVSGSAGVEDLSTGSFVFVVRSAFPSGSLASDLGSGSAIFARSSQSGCGITANASGQLFLTVARGNTCALDVEAEGSRYLYGLEYIPTGETEPLVLAQGAFVVRPDVVRTI